MSFSNIHRMIAIEYHVVIVCSFEEAECKGTSHARLVSRHIIVHIFG